MYGKQRNVCGLQWSIQTQSPPDDIPWWLLISIAVRYAPNQYAPNRRCACTLHGCITSTCPEQLVLIKILLRCVRDRECIEYFHVLDRLNHWSQLEPSRQNFYVSFFLCQNFHFYYFAKIIAANLSHLTNGSIAVIYFNFVLRKCT